MTDEPFTLRNDPPGDPSRSQQTLWCESDVQELSKPEESLDGQRDLFEQRDLIQ